MLSRLCAGCLERAAHYLELVLTAPASWLWKD